MVSDNKSANYEFRLVSSLPIELKNRLKDAEGNNVNINQVSPGSLVCIEITDNPGAIPFLVDGINFYNFFKQKVEKTGFSIMKAIDALKRKEEQ